MRRNSVQIGSAANVEVSIAISRRPSSIDMDAEGDDVAGYQMQMQFRQPCCAAQIVALLQPSSTLLAFGAARRDAGGGDIC
ncbi:MAG: hypothetical protein E5Y73_27795 [Mesorhizobium sp.]|uniref:hypothetical protein n=1 Tax=Mesorhizobium sp. TaxID=1871066 RepID=UPI0011FAF4E4|nr:hypothetical protein [Mesorhizobium sp.]TIL86243.1 MAG: hypothetical protein E5Y73_27795 [Mesorhizobium sp.]